MHNDEVRKEETDSTQAACSQTAGARNAGMEIEKIYQLSSDIICIADLTGPYFRKVNPAFSAILGYPEDEAYSRPVMSFIHPDDRERTMRAVQEEQRSGAETINFSNRYQHRDGSYVWIEWRTRPVPAEGLTYAIGRNISDRRRMEQELLKLQKLESIGLLAGGIAHDFNNLLMSIMGSVSYSRTMLPPEGTVSRLLSEAEQACYAAKELSYRLLTFSRGGEPVRRPASLGLLIRDSAGIALAGSTVSAELDVPEDLPLSSVDEGQIRQVLNNLLVNAREVTPAGGHVKLQARGVSVHEQEVPALAPGRYIKLLVQDHGAGIPEKDVPRIFDPYFSTKEMGSQKGRGLGLAICLSIIRKHEGTIVVESEAGRGSSFAIYLPALAEHQVSAANNRADEAGKTPANRKILVMDDDERVSNIVGKMLQSLNYTVEIVSDGNQAVERYFQASEAGSPFALVLLDLTVTRGMGGIDALRKLRAGDHSVRAILSSGYTENAVLRDFRPYGFSGALAKPYSIEQLERVISQVLTEV